MRSIQEIFDTVINAGYYNPYLRDHYSVIGIPVTSDGARRSYYMCDSLAIAYSAGLITQQEMFAAQHRIEEYLRSDRLYTMYETLVFYNLPSAPIDLISLYRDWDNRPVLAKVY